MPDLSIPPPFEHQKKVMEFLLKTPRALVTSDPGTGKTRSVVDAHSRRMREGKMLVLAPLSCLQSAWGGDIEKFMPFLRYGVATAGKRERAFDPANDVVLGNHDMVKWLDAQKHDWLEGFSTLVIDEFTAFKHRGSGRSKALARLVRKHPFPYRIAMSGTPNANSILDLWHPLKVVDDGERLGTVFSAFQQEVCRSVFNPFSPSGAGWEPREDATETVKALIGDITIRYSLDDCLDLPAQSMRDLLVPLPAPLTKLYREFAREGSMDNGGPKVTAVHASARAQKLLQLASGVIYDESGGGWKVDATRVKKVADLIQERDFSVTVFQWRIQRMALSQELDKRGVPHAWLDGTVRGSSRSRLIEDFQNGAYSTLLIHPAAAGHGITLTRANSAIWMSPTHNAEHWEQTNARIRRAGQNRNTEIVRISAPGTGEARVYGLLEDKLAGLDELLKALEEKT